jgi:hypothetical protein
MAPAQNDKMDVIMKPSIKENMENAADRPSYCR